MNFKMESSIGEFPNIRKFLTLRSPDKSGKNSPALRTNSEIFQGEPLQKLSTKNHVFSYFPKMNNLTSLLPKKYFNKYV